MSVLVGRAQRHVERRELDLAIATRKEHGWRREKGERLEGTVKMEEDEKEERESRQGFWLG
jgi:hypothetical protein